MPNPIDMVQFLARVRENTGYKMDLTIIGNYGDYSRVQQDLTQYKSKSQLTNVMSTTYEGFRNMDLESYIGILDYYNIGVTELTDLGFKANKMVFAGKLSYKYIADNFHNFPKEYAIIISNLDNDQQRYQIDLITGDKTISGGSSERVQRVFNHFDYAAKYKIPIECFHNETYSIDNYKMLVTLNEEYHPSTDDIFSTMINNIVNPTGPVLKYKELGYKELIKSEKKVVRQVFRVFYEPCDFRDANVELVEKKGGNADVKKHLYTITCRGSNYSMTAPPTAPFYDF